MMRISAPPALLFAGPGRAWLDRETLEKERPTKQYAAKTWDRLFLEELPQGITTVAEDFRKLEDVDAKFTVHLMAPGGFWPSRRGFNDIREAIVTKEGKEILSVTEQKRFILFSESAKHFCKRVLQETKLALGVS